MNKFFNNLPKLSTDEQRRKDAGSNGKTIKDNFTVKKCPLMDNFDNMDPDTLWKKLSNSPFTDVKEKKEKFVNIEAYQEKQDINTLPEIQGIQNIEDKDEEDDVHNIFLPDQITSIYIGSLSLVGLFILFRVANRSK